MPPPMIAGLYPYARGGQVHPPSVTLREIPESLAINPRYREDLLVLAGDRESALHLESFGLRVHRVFDDAPAAVRRDAAHLMKHWMVLWALREYGECLWVDWDTVSLRRPDAAFWAWCRSHGTPKFIQIPNYWATVNCGVYFVGGDWAEAMEGSLSAKVSEPNDELHWATILPGDVRARAEFWWGDRVVNIWDQQDIELITTGTYFAHVKELSWAAELRSRSRSVPEHNSLSRK